MHLSLLHLTSYSEQHLAASDSILSIDCVRCFLAYACQIAGAMGCEDSEKYHPRARVL